MVKIIDIQSEEARFINRKRLEEIKCTIQRLPQGEYYYDKEIYCKYSKADIGHPIFSTPYYPGLVELLVNLKSDMEALIKHVENADLENDKLIETIRHREKCLLNQKK